MILFSWLLLITRVDQDTAIRYYLAVGEIEKAREICSKDTLGCAKFLRGEIAYFNYKFEQALEFYSKVPDESRDANDALSRIILIKEVGQPQELPLQDYVTAELLGRKKKFEDGIKILKKLRRAESLDKATTMGTPTIAPWASMLLVELFQKSKKQKEALKECENFIRRFPGDEKLPQVKLKMGKIYANLGKKEEAREIYKEILLKHPNFSVAPIAREELENL